MKIHLMKTAFNSLLHLFFPHTCAGCGSDILQHDQLLCLHCIERLPHTNFHRFAGNPVEKIFWGRLPIACATSFLYFTKSSLLQHLVHQFKYNGKKEIGQYIGRRMGEVLLESSRFGPVDALVPLPLYAARERKRGYNQSGILCEGIAEIMQVPVLKNIITRKSATETQTRKNRTERWANISGRFELLQPETVRDKHILLVDDVITTGATLEACGQELMAAGNTRLSIFTMAISSRQ
jgi:ComF family protein